MTRNSGAIMKFRAFDGGRSGDARCARFGRRGRSVCRRRCISRRRCSAAPVYNWTGCYVGAGGGYAFWQQDSFVTLNGTPVTASQSNGGKGWFGQGQVGCDYQFTAPYFGVQTVIGAFGDFAGGSINGSNSFPGLTGSEKESSTWAVGGRAGVLVTPRFLTYFDGGYTQARFDGVNYNIAIAGVG